MKAKPIIGALVIADLLLTVLGGCSHKVNSDNANSYESISANVLGDSSESEITGNIENNSENIDSSVFTDPPSSFNYGDCIIKSYKKAIDTEGVILNNMEQTSNKFLTAMDNDNLYFDSNSFPITISSYNRKNSFTKDEIMTYNPDVELQLGNNKKTYCGCYFTFPCNGDPSNDIYLSALVGKSGEDAKCVLQKKTYSISVCAAELNATEMVFLCGGENKNEYEIYKYKVGNDQASLIYTTELDSVSQNSNPLISCYNEEIYLIYRSSNIETAFNIKRLNSNGNVIDDEILELPKYSDMRISEFTVLSNHIIIRFGSRNNGFSSYFKHVVIERRGKKIFSDIGDNRLGMRYNDHIIDDRYIIFKVGLNSDSACPTLCVFDDRNSEFHYLEFNTMKDIKIINTAVDYNGDLLFLIQENDTRSLVLYEDIISLI